MGLETSTFLSGLTATWPLAGDKKNQGDDHLRLIKTTLQATFPSADRPFYFPKTEAVAALITLDATDQNNDLIVDTSGGNIVVNLPSTLGAGDKGWECSVVKIGTDVNAAIVTPAAGTIVSKSGATATIRVGIVCDPVRFKWSGTGWYCYKSGPMIGSTESFDGPTTPPGYLDADGASFSSTNFAELFAVLASSVARDKRGRLEAGVDNGAVNRLTASYFGTASVLGAVGGGESNTLVQAGLPAVILTVAGSVNVIARTNGTVQSGGGGTTVVLDALQLSGGGGTTSQVYSLSGTTSALGSGAAHANVQPTIVVKKIIRAC